MRIDKYNKSLYWQNFIGNMQVILGALFLMASMFFFIIGEGIWYLIFIPIAIYFFISGNQRRLDYKRKSGYMIYN